MPWKFKDDVLQTGYSDALYESSSSDENCLNN